MYKYLRSCNRVRMHLAKGDGGAGNWWNLRKPGRSRLGGSSGKKREKREEEEKRPAHSVGGRRGIDAGRAVTVVAVNDGRGA